MIDGYVYKQTAIDEINKALDRETLLNSFVRKIAVEAVKKLPTADVVEVVRCKDCKYCDTGIDEDGNHFLKCLGWVYGGTKEDDYCSHGVRKDG